MLSVIDNGAPAPCPAPFNLAEYVLAAGRATPDRIALVILRAGGAERWSYGRLSDAVLGVAGGLLERGLRPGDRLLLRLGNGVSFPLAFLGAIAAGIVPVPTPAGLTTTEVARVVAMVRPAMIVAGPGIALPDPVAVPVLSEADLRGFEGGPRADWAMGDPERMAYVVMTSGTSGSPRAVAHAHRVVWARRMMHQGWEGLRPEDRLLHAGAFNWTYTLGTGLMDPWTLGATALIPGAGVTPDQLPRLLQQYEATICAAAPGVFRQMLRAPLPALPHLRHGLSAGESLPPALRQAWRAATGTDLHEALGMSECSTFISGAPGRPAPEGCAGYAQPGRAIAILGNDGQPVPRDEAGMLAVSRHDPGLMLHYVQDPVETAARFCGDWFLTGDLAVMRKDGALTYLGRDDDQMNPGGYRVSPQEVEAALAGLPGVQDIAVTEVEVKPGSKVVACFYVAPQPLDPATLAAFAAERLARYRQPRLWQHVVALPRNANGKLNRRALAAAWRPE